MNTTTKALKWRKGEFKIATKPNCTLENQTDTRKGYTLAGVFGIDNQMRSVTHLPTGLKLPGYFSLVRNAKAYAEALLPLTDWLTLTQDNATIGTDNGDVCDVRSHWPQSHADAALISAAPEMLEICEAMSLVGIWGKSSPILAKAQAVIRKAKGQ